MIQDFIGLLLIVSALALLFVALGLIVFKYIFDYIKRQ